MITFKEWLNKNNVKEEVVNGDALIKMISPMIGVTNPNDPNAFANGFYKTLNPTYKAALTQAIQGQQKVQQPQQPQMPQAPTMNAATMPGR